MAHTPLITRDELPQYGVSSDFLGQFAVRPIEVRVMAGGALGIAALAWRRLGETKWSPAETSSSRAPWVWSPSKSFARLTFAAGTYVADSTYTVDEDGAVTGSGGAIETVTAARWDQVALAIAGVTEQAVGKMRPGKTPPLLAWGDGVKRLVGAWIRYELGGDVGMAPAAVAAGAENVQARALEAMRTFERIGAGSEDMPEIVDSSARGYGTAIQYFPSGDDERGW